VTTAYTTTYFLGGFAGPRRWEPAYRAYVWPGVCAGGVGFTQLGLLVLAWDGTQK
jgi:hypothetical protein